MVCTKTALLEIVTNNFGRECFPTPAHRLDRDIASDQLRDMRRRCGQAPMKRSRRATTPEYSAGLAASGRLSDLSPLRIIIDSTALS